MFFSFDLCVCERQREKGGAPLCVRVCVCASHCVCVYVCERMCVGVNTAGSEGQIQERERKG